MTHKNEFEHILEGCLEMLLDGEGDIDALVAPFPEHAERLRAELEAAAWLRAGRRAFDASPGFADASRRRLIARIQAESFRPPDSLHGRVSALFTRRRFALQFALLLLLALSMFFSANRAVQASQTCLPGDPLYPLKTTLESARLLFTRRAAGRADLYTQFADQRLLEVQALVIEGRFEQIPATVLVFERYVASALRAMNQVAARDRGQAQALALALQDTLSSQTNLVLLLGALAPQQSRPQFERVRFVSEQGFSEMQELFTPSSGERQIWATRGEPARLALERPWRARLTDLSGSPPPCNAGLHPAFSTLKGRIDFSPDGGILPGKVEIM